MRPSAVYVWFSGRNSREFVEPLRPAASVFLHARNRLVIPRMTGFRYGIGIDSLRLSGNKLNILIFKCAFMVTSSHFKMGAPVLKRI